MCVKIRDCLIEDLASINQLILASKAVWGYSPEFMEAAKEDLLIRKEDFSKFHLHLLCKEDGILGVCGFRKESKVLEMEYLFVSPMYIGKGYGRKLFEFAIELTRSFDEDFFLICSDPNALPFYERMGAAPVGEVSSPVDSDRKLPILIYLVNPGLELSDILSRIST